jgi:hypothetical protein
VGVSPLQLVNLHRNRWYFVIKLHTWFCLSFFLKTNIKLYCIYQYFMSINSFFNTVSVSRYSRPITNETSHVTIHATHSDPWPTLARSSSLFLICCLNIWIYYTIIFCRFTFCFYILMAKQTNRGKRSVFNETHLQKIFFENWRTTKLCEKKERTSEQCHEFVKK